MLRFCALIFCLNVLVSCNSKPKAISEEIIVQKEIDSFQIINTTITKALVLGMLDYKTDTTFVKVDSKYTTKATYLHKETYEAFKKMYNASKKDSITLIIISGARNFKYQKNIWERKWAKYKYLKPLERAKYILKYSSMPGTSRHHWGTDLDLNSLNNSYFNGVKGKSVYKWLKSNANSFGFYQVYTSKDKGRTGYNEEKWHWSYLPLASNYLTFYNTNIAYEDVKGFKGDSLTRQLQMLPNYVNGISYKAKAYK